MGNRWQINSFGLWQKSCHGNRLVIGWQSMGSRLEGRARKWQALASRLASSWQAIVWGVEMQRDDDAGSGDPIAPPSSRYASDQKDTVSRQRNS
ncbi:MAG: hypothetical protein CVV54_04920 [Synergistetes bacterium HGW-Synergistetes-1]|nr:MAG: hypothetical protein CVV54_04920 [Synergistetes bacterium HGW-Synergistetes-1]